MATLTTPIKSDTWIKAPWSDFIQATENPDYEKGKFYYYQDHLRIEMSPVGNDHAGDHAIVTGSLSLYIAVKQIPVTIRDTCSYRKPGQWEVQPDISCHVGDNAMAIPYGTGIVNLDEYPPPDLVIEIANTSLADDQGKKRLLYEVLGVREYWIVDVKAVKILAFKMENQTSYSIQTSQVLDGLELSILEEALKMTRQTSHTQVTKWLLEQFS